MSHSAPCRSVGTLADFWDAGGHFSEGRQRLENAFFAGDSSAPTGARAKALTGAALLARLSGDAEIDEALCGRKALALIAWLVTYAASPSPASCSVWGGRPPRGLLEGKVTLRRQRAASRKAGVDHTAGSRAARLLGWRDEGVRRLRARSRRPTRPT